MKKLVFDYEMKLSFSSPVTDHRFQLRCIPATGPRQQVIDVAVKIEPDVELETTIDSSIPCDDRIHSRTAHHVQLLGDRHRLRGQRAYQNRNLQAAVPLQFGVDSAGAGHRSVDRHLP